MPKRIVNDPEALKAKLRKQPRGGFLKGYRDLQREHRRVEDVPATECELAETVDYQGFMVRVYKRLDVNSVYCFQPTILKDGVEVHQIFVRSKTPYVSIEHFAKRAIDVFLKAGQWPAKQGISLGK